MPGRAFQASVMQHFSLLDPFLSYKENEVLLKRLQYSLLLKNNLPPKRSSLALALEIIDHQNALA
jgi:hypothetical protein